MSSIETKIIVKRRQKIKFNSLSGSLYTCNVRKFGLLYVFGEKIATHISLKTDLFDACEVLSRCLSRSDTNTPLYKISKIN